MAGRAYTSVRLIAEVRDTAQRSALTLSAEIGRRLSISDIVRAALAVADQHPDELRAALAAPEQKGTDSE